MEKDEIEFKTHPELYGFIFIVVIFRYVRHFVVVKFRKLFQYFFSF